jgi:hypothetical protein
MIISYHRRARATIGLIPDNDVQEYPPDTLPSLPGDEPSSPSHGSVSSDSSVSLHRTDQINITHNIIKEFIDEKIERHEKQKRRLKKQKKMWYLTNPSLKDEYNKRKFQKTCIAAQKIASGITRIVHDTHSH